MKTKTKLLLALVSATALTAGVFGLTACGEDNTSVQDSSLYAAYTKYKEENSTSELSYEEWVNQLITSISAGGTNGTDGTDGVNGKSAYELYVDSLGEGETPLNEKDWLASLKGADGQPGSVGQPGSNGDPGSDGVGIKSVEYSADGKYLVIVYTNNKIDNIEIPAKAEDKHDLELYAVYEAPTDEKEGLGFLSCKDDDYIELTTLAKTGYTSITFKANDKDAIVNTEVTFTAKQYVQDSATGKWSIQEVKITKTTDNNGAIAVPNVIRDSYNVTFKYLGETKTVKTTEDTTCVLSVSSDVIDASKLTENTYTISSVGEYKFYVTGTYDDLFESYLYDKPIIKLSAKESATDIKYKVTIDSDDVRMVDSFGDKITIQAVKVEAGKESSFAYSIVADGASAFFTVKVEYAANGEIELPYEATIGTNTLECLAVDSTSDTTKYYAYFTYDASKTNQALSHNFTFTSGSISYLGITSNVDLEEGASVTSGSSLDNLSTDYTNYFYVLSDTPEITFTIDDIYKTFTYGTEGNAPTEGWYDYTSTSDKLVKISRGSASEIVVYEGGYVGISGVDYNTVADVYNGNDFALFKMKANTRYYFCVYAGDSNTNVFTVVDAADSDNGTAAGANIQLTSASTTIESTANVMYYSYSVANAGQLVVTVTDEEGQSLNATVSYYDTLSSGSFVDQNYFANYSDKTTAYIKVAFETAPSKYVVKVEEKATATFVYKIKVLDSDGNVVEGAKVKLNIVEKTENTDEVNIYATTGSDGVAVFEAIAPVKTATVTNIEKVGYEFDGGTSVYEEDAFESTDSTEIPTITVIKQATQQFVIKCGDTTAPAGLKVTIYGKYYSMGALTDKVLGQGVTDSEGKVSVLYTSIRNTFSSGYTNYNQYLVLVGDTDSYGMSEAKEFEMSTDAQTIELTAKQAYTVTVVNSENSGLAGVTISFEDVYGNSYEAVTNGNGVATFETPVVLGEYKITATDVPTGFKISGAVTDKTNKEFTIIAKEKVASSFAGEHEIDLEADNVNVVVEYGSEVIYITLTVDVAGTYTISSPLVDKYYYEVGFVKKNGNDTAYEEFYTLTVDVGDEMVIYISGMTGDADTDVFTIEKVD